MKKNYGYLLCLMIVWNACYYTATAQDIVKRDLLHRFSPSEIATALVPRDQWHPFPQTRSEWQRLVPDSVRRSVIQEAAKYLHQPFSPISANLYLEFQRNGNRTDFENVSFAKRDQLFSLVLAESMEHQGRFMNDIVDGIWSICEETFWGDPAHYYLQKAGIGLPDVEDPSVDIFASETAELLALTDYFVGPELDSISPLLRRRIYYEVNRRILVPLSRDEIPYHYLGPGKKDAPVNNWNPWVISNWMVSLLLLESNEQRRARELTHAMYLLDNYINGLGDDGAVDEGPSYWFGGAGRLFDMLIMLKKVTGGQVDIFGAPVIQRLGAYIEKMHIAGNYFIDIADASPAIEADGLLIFRVGRSLQNKDLTAFGAWAYHHIDKRDFLHQDIFKPRIVWNLLAIKDCQALNPPLPPAGDVWFQHIQLMAGSTKHGLFVASHAGNNGESHNHNDVGDVMVYSEGQPVIVDVGFGTYTAKTFSKDRYSLWYLRSAYHNLPTINGIEQGAARKYEAHQVQYRATATALTLQMDIAPAYPPEAGVQKWERTVSLDKNRNTLSVTDAYTLSKRSGPLTQSFMTVCPVNLQKPGQIVFTVSGHRSVVLSFDPREWKVEKELMSTSKPDEQRIANDWNHRPIWRLLLINQKNKQKGVFHYLIRQL